MSINYILNNYIAKILPIISIILFLFQFSCNWYYYSNLEIVQNNKIHSITKYLYIYFYIWSFISFIMTYITEPGYVTSKTNEQYLCLYRKSRKYSLNRAKIYNDNHSKDNDNLKESDDSDLYTDGLSSEDEVILQETKFQNAFYQNYKNYRHALNFNVKKCRQCHITKVSGIVHCSVCHKCVYMKDHHCIWFNQCIGQFNLKYFILFLLYLLLCSYISLMKCFYYIIFKNYAKIFSEYSFKQNLFLYTFLALDTIYVIFSIKLLYDQYTNLNDFSILYDFKRNKMIEIRTKYEMISEIFGEKFGIGWFFPFKVGGFYGLFKNENKNVKIEKYKNN